MTLVVGISTSKSLWMLTDRRLSFKAPTPPRESAFKVFELNATDGKAFVGYSGLGLTGGRMEPSDWLGNVFRGRSYPVEQSLELVANAAAAQFPKHLARLAPGRTFMQRFVAAAHVNQLPRMYSVSVGVDAAGQRVGPVLMRHVNRPDVVSDDHLNALLLYGTGSGAAVLLGASDFKRWRRQLSRLVRAHDRGVVPHTTVINFLAKLNSRIHDQQVARHRLDASKVVDVGPRSIVSWSVPGQGGHTAFTDTSLEQEIPLIPTTGGGIRADEISAACIRLIKAHGMNVHEHLADEIAKISDTPDERLR